MINLSKERNMADKRLNINRVSALLLLISFLAFFGCSNNQDNKYVKEQVLKMYENETHNPVIELSNSINNAKSNAEINLINSNYQMRVQFFNDKCVKTVTNDPVLSEYFNSLIKKMDDDELSIKTLNYFGIIVRKELEEDLEIELLE